MLNPDGVVAGNYRTSFSGDDLNRWYVHPNKRLNPTISSIKKLVKENSNILAFFDLHGHSRKKSVFFYGPRYPLHHRNYFKQRVIPKLFSEQSEIFRYYSCKFRTEKEKGATARIVMWKEFGIMNSFTLETSFMGYLNSERTTVMFTKSIYEDIG